MDLVFLDVWLPNMGGIDVLKRIREQHPDVEVIMISGHANISLAVQATKMGAFDFLEKPLSLDRTMTVVRNALAMETLRRENRTLKTASSSTTGWWAPARGMAPCGSSSTRRPQATPAS